MNRDPHNPRIPGLFEQLSLLPPTVQIGASLLMLAMGAGAIAMMPGGFGAIEILDLFGCLILVAIAAAIGIPLGLQGLRLRRERRVEAEEMERAKAEVHELRLLVEEAVERQRGVERVLMKQGFTSAKVRRWIALECDIVLPDRGL